MFEHATKPLSTGNLAWLKLPNLGWQFNGIRRPIAEALVGPLFVKMRQVQGYIDRTPIAHIEKPSAGKREQIVTTSEFETIFSHVKDESFRDLLTVTWETGCRPQESLRVEARRPKGTQRAKRFGDVLSDVNSSKRLFSGRDVRVANGM